jgi:hypothetical protein
MADRKQTTHMLAIYDVSGGHMAAWSITADAADHLRKQLPEPSYEALFSDEQRAAIAAGALEHMILLPGASEAAA